MTNFKNVFKVLRLEELVKRAVPFIPPVRSSIMLDIKVEMDGYFGAARAAAISDGNRYEELSRNLNGAKNLAAANRINFNNYSSEVDTVILQYVSSRLRKAWSYTSSISSSYTSSSMSSVSQNLTERFIEELEAAETAASSFERLHRHTQPIKEAATGFVKAAYERAESLTGQKKPGASHYYEMAWAIALSFGVQMPPQK